MEYKDLEGDNNPGSGTGLDMLIKGKLSFSESSEDVEKQYFDAAKHQGITLKYTPVAIDAIAIFVHPGLINEGVKSLTLSQASDIFTGKITNWKAVGGPDCKITAFTREENASGTVKVFQRIVLGGQPFGGHVIQSVRDTTKLIKSVSDTPGSISFTSVTLAINQETIRILPVAKQDNSPPVSLCHNQTCKSINTSAFPDYPIIRYILVVFKKSGKIDEKASVAYINMLLSNQGRKIVEEAGFLTPNLCF